MAASLRSLLALDVKTLIGILFWGNLICALLITTYRFSSHPLPTESRLANNYILAKLCQGFAFFCLFFRVDLPPVISVNVGNTLLLTGFYLEALAMLIVVQENRRVVRRLVLILFLIATVAFNGVEALYPDSSVRISIASLCVFSILAIPNGKLLLARDISRFKRLVAFFYTFFLMLQLPRAIYAMKHPVTIYSSFLIQEVTFLSLVLLLLFSLSSYLLLMKEDADRTIGFMASMDLLTGLANRYSFLEGAERIFESHKHNGKQLALVFMDIDSFKRINDTYGHVFGDEVLARVGEIIKGSLRSDDLSSRYGGEEFIMLLPNTDRENACKITQRILDEIAKAVFPKHPDFAFTISAGLNSEVPRASETLTEYIEKADRALYEAKIRGKNRVVDYEVLGCICKLA